MTVCPRFLLSSLFLCLLTYTSLANAANRGMIWKVEKGNHVSYLMGAIHFGDESFYPLSKNTMDAYHASTVMYVEVDEHTLSAAEQQAIVMKYAVYPDGERLQDHLSSSSLKLFEAALAEFGVQLHTVENQRPGFLTVMLAALQAQQLGYRVELGIDYYFIEKARGNKSIRQIESFEDQMRLLSQLPSDEASLRDSFADMADYEGIWNSMTTAWKRGDSDQLYKVIIADSLAEYPTLAGLFEQLFFARNIKIAQVAQSCIKQQQVCFIVVGAGHLVGERGVVDLLEKRGYLIKQL